MKEILKDWRLWWIIRFAIRCAVSAKFAIIATLGIWSIIKAPWLKIEIHPGIILLEYFYGGLDFYMYYYLGWKIKFPSRPSQKGRNEKTDEPAETR